MKRFAKFPDGWFIFPAVLLFIFGLIIDETTIISHELSAHIASFMLLAIAIGILAVPSFNHLIENRCNQSWLKAVTPCQNCINCLPGIAVICAIFTTQHRLLGEICIMGMIFCFIIMLYLLLLRQPSSLFFLSEDEATRAKIWSALNTLWSKISNK